MKIFIIEKPERRDSLVKYLDKYDDIVFLFKQDTEDISAYSEILEDTDDTIIVVAPSLIGWKIPNDFLEQVKNLKGIVTKSSWGHYIDLEYCAEKGIVVGNAPGANARAVAEYAVWQMLSLLRKAPLQITEKFKTEVNNDSEGLEAKEKTAGILGMGRIGRDIAQILSGMGMKVIYWNRAKKDLPYKYTSIDELLAESDVIFKCWETCDQTKDLLHDKNLQLLKQNAHFISVFGGIGWSGEDDYILLEYTEQGRIGGFSIENDHHKDAKVKKQYKGNVFIPAALAWHTKETHSRYNRILADTIIGIVENNPTNRVE